MRLGKETTLPETMKVFKSMMAPQSLIRQKVYGKGSGDKSRKDDTAKSTARTAFRRFGGSATEALGPLLFTWILLQEQSTREFPGHLAGERLSQLENEGSGEKSPLLAANFPPHKITK